MPASRFDDDPRSGRPRHNYGKSLGVQTGMRTRLGGARVNESQSSLGAHDYHLAVAQEKQSDNVRQLNCLPSATDAYYQSTEPR